jgi:hypothetical protein
MKLPRESMKLPMTAARLPMKIPGIFTPKHEMWFDELPGRFRIPAKTLGDNCTSASRGQVEAGHRGLSMKSVGG